MTLVFFTILFIVATAFMLTLVMAAVLFLFLRRRSGLVVLRTSRFSVR